MSTVTPVVPFHASTPTECTPPLTSTTISTAQPPAAPHSKPVQFLHRLWDTWLDLLHVSHSGTYSIERMLALEEYAHCSYVRVVAVCLLMPLPTLLFVVCIELLPLRDAFAGWQANEWFWIRHFVLTVVTMECNAMQLKKLVPDLPWRRGRVLALSLSTGVVSVCGAIAIAQLWVFPIPFFMVVVGIPFTSIWVKGFERMVLSELPTLAPDFKQRFDRANDLFNVQGALVSVYPIYNALFVMLPSHLQPAFVVVLPVIKMVLKKKVAERLVGLEDYLPEEAVFTVDLFNALYMVNCMQNTTTPATTAVILAIDSILSTLSLYGLSQRTNILQSLHRQHLDATDAAASIATTPPPVANSNSTTETPSLRKLMLAMLQHPDRIDHNVLVCVRVEACVPHKLTPTHRQLLQTLVRVRSECPVASPSTRQAPARKWSLLHAVGAATSTIHPIPQATPQRQSLATHHGTLQTTPSQQLELNQRQKSRLLQQTLRAMFNIEFLVLIEYVECMIPILYAIYLPILVHLPNGQFYPHARAFQHDHERLRSVLANILLFAALEVVSLVAFCGILRQKFQFSPLHQVAFVLESQWTLVQAKLIVWLIYSLQFTIDHQGADFKFQFQWLKS